jgi:hypothetical protein
MIFPDMIELDQYLWQEVTDRLTKLASSDYQFEKKMREFASRRESVSSLKISIAGPDDFVRL